MELSPWSEGECVWHNMNMTRTGLMELNWCSSRGLVHEGVDGITCFDISSFRDLQKQKIYRTHVTDHQEKRNVHIIHVSNPLFIFCPKTKAKNPLSSWDQLSLLVAFMVGQWGNCCIDTLYGLPNHTYNLPDSRIFTCYHTELTWIPVLFLFPTTRSLVSPTCSWSYSNMSGSVEPEILGLWDGQQRCRGLVGTLDFGLAWDAVSMLRRKQQNQILSCPSLVSLIRWDSIYVNMNVSVFCINVSPSWTLNQGSFL